MNQLIDTYTDVEIRLYAAQSEGHYPLELTLDGRQEFAGGELSLDMADFVPTSSPRADGQRLFQALFATEEAKLAWAKISGQSPRRRIRLRLDPQTPALHQLPWELLHEATPLAADADTPFSRYLAGDWPPKPPLTARPVKLLIAVANPDNLTDYNNLTPIDVAREEAIIRETFADIAPTELTLTFLAAPVSLTALEQELQQGYHLLHLIAHGQFSQRQQTASLCLADEQNEVQWVSVEKFGAMVARLSTPPQLVLLASCQTAVPHPRNLWGGFGPRLIAAGVPVVIAMQGYVPVVTARQFSQLFYQHLLAHGQVDLACNQARAGLLTGEFLGSDMPVLFSRLPDNQLFAAPEAVAPPAVMLAAHAVMQGSEIAGRDITIGQKITNFFMGGRADAQEQRNRQAMLDLVEETWVKGLLENSLQEAVLLTLGLENRPSAVINGRQMVLQVAQQSPQTLPPDTSILTLFQQQHEALLILGEPGAGKTTTLLELARATIALARQDPSYPMPVVFNLSTWHKEPLADWLTEAFSSFYQIPRKIARAWLEHDQLLLLLDGLDEVEVSHRAACVTAINQFRTEHFMPMAVCSRLADYEALESKLELQGAVRLQALNPAQIEHYLTATDSQTVRLAIAQDRDLQELAQSPLMLSLMSVAYRDVSPQALPQLADSAARHRHLFDNYVQQMFTRRLAAPRYTPEQTRAWLNQLAHNMSHHAQSIFLLEQLQPSWLPTRGGYWLYMLATRVGAMWLLWLLGLLVLGLVFSVSDGQLPSFDNVIGSILLSGVISGTGIVPTIADGLRQSYLARYPALQTKTTSWWYTLLSILGFMVLVSGSFGVVFGFFVKSGNVFNIAISTPLALFFGLRGRWQRRTLDIYPLEGVYWSWRSFGGPFLIGLVVAGLLWGYGSLEKKWSVWNLATGQEQTAFRNIVPTSWGEWLSNDQLVTMHQESRGLSLWDTTANKIIFKINGEINDYKKIANNRLLTISISGKLILWNTTTSETIFETDKVNRFDWLTDNRLITLQEGGKLLLWDITTGKTTFETSQVFVYYWLADNRLITLQEGGKLLLWDITTGKTTFETSQVKNYHWLADNRLITLQEGGKLLLRDTTTGKTTFETDKVNQFYWLADGRLITLREGGDLWLWDMMSGKTIFKLSQIKDYNLSDSTSMTGYSAEDTGKLELRDNNYIFTFGIDWWEKNRLLTLNKGGELELWDITTGKTTFNASGVTSYESLTNNLITLNDGGELGLWDITTGKTTLKTSGVTSYESLTNNRLITLNDRGELGLWDITTGKIIFEAKQVKKYNWLAASHLVIETEAGSWQLWDTATNKKLVETSQINSYNENEAQTKLFTAYNTMWYGNSLRFWSMTAGFIGLVIGLMRGWQSKVMQSKTKVNQGIWLSLRNGCLLGSFYGGIGTGIIWIIQIIMFYFSTGRLSLLQLDNGELLLLFVLTTTLVFFWYGGLDAWQHFCLRVLLWRRGIAPLRYVEFLDFAAERILLRKVGGGYIFVHRLLLEYFAGLRDSEGTEARR